MQLNALFLFAKSVLTRSARCRLLHQSLSLSMRALRRYATISCRKMVFAALQWHFPSHNNVIWLTNCFKILQWKILVGDMYFFQHSFHPHTRASNCGKLQKNGITIWWLNRWFMLNSIAFPIYLSQSHLWQNIKKHIGDPTWKFIQSLFVR